jgi:acetyltransferase
MLLEAYGIPLVPERIADTADEAEAAARKLGFPAVVKTAVPGVHKTDIGGVALDLRDAAQVRDAVDRIEGARDRPAVPRRRDGFSRAPCRIPSSARLSPSGRAAQRRADRRGRLRLAPLTVLDAQELVLDGRQDDSLQASEAQHQVNAGALVDLLLRLDDSRKTFLSSQSST